MKWDTSTPVLQIAESSCLCERVFARLKLIPTPDPHATLAQACRVRGLDPRTVVLVLRAAEQEPVASAHGDWSGASLTDLCDHIVHTHHAYLRTELPRLSELIGRVAEAHDANHPELRRLAGLYAHFRHLMEPHMAHEEQVLFPVIEQLDMGLAPDGATCPGNLERPIFALITEHEDAEEQLDTIRECTRDYAVPADACESYRALMGALAQLDADMRQHMHEETHILFPRALRDRKKSARSA
jgi:regulator of cell morphogenesis and NO signaling